MRALTALMLLAVAASSSPLSADESAKMTVSASVIARAIVNVNQEPGEIVITDADLARGYVDVAEPLVLHVRSNSPRGYLLQVGNRSAAFAAVELAFGNTSMTVTEESWVARPSVRGGEMVSAQMRVRLTPGTVAGRHALPLQVSATPL